ncbi:3-deoxy-manno-octulosonate cytidylyltransferase [uncultured Helicobacter sp.]|uniref:3-deoxy-manno-octulosonate cytidylyltransferase n=1 Tax=uncultured Helicobacter sp. TaxID=175537 RepID=UPI00374EE209
MIIIPARLESTRLPKKVLCDLGGMPMIVRTAKNAQRVDEVVVACDDEEIMQVCKSYNITSVLTAKSHSSGTDRCAEAANILGLRSDDIVINLQADEPFIETYILEVLAQLTKTSNAFLNTLARVISPDTITDSNLVKVVVDAHKHALYFSRLGVPYARDGVDMEIVETYPYLGHLGLYGFKKQCLDEFCALPQSPLEQIEKLEQLRALYHGKTIALEIVETKSMGIDTPEDLCEAQKYLTT